MAQTVDTLVVRIEADMKDMRRELNRLQRDVKKSTNKMTGAFAKMGKAVKILMAAVVVREIARASGFLLKLASDAEEMQGKSKVVFGKFRADVVKELTAFGDAVGRSSFELEQMASTVQDTFVPLGFSRGEAAKLSVALTKLAVDTASFNNASDVGTMEAFKSTLVGNHETVRRFGVVIDQAAIKQELFNMGIKGGINTATNAQKVQARLNLITDGVADANGDAADTAGSFANETRALVAELKELAIGIMENVLPAATVIVDALGKATKATKEFLVEMGMIKGTPAEQIEKLNGKLKNLTQTYNDQLKNQNDAYDAILMVTKAESDREAATVAHLKVVGEMSEEFLSNMHNTRDAIQQIAGDNFMLEFQGPPMPEHMIPKELTETEKLLLELRTKQLDLFADTVSNQKELNSLAEMERKAEASGKSLDEAKYQLALDLYNLKLDFPNLTEDELLEQRKLLAVNRAMVLIHEDQLRLKEELKKSIESGVNIAAPEREIFNDLNEQIRDVKNALDAGKISTEEYNRALADIGVQALELDPAFVQMKDRIQSTADSMTDSLTQMVMDGKINFQSMKDMFKDMVRQMIADALKAQVIKPLIGGLFGGIGTAIGGPIGTAFSAVGAQASPKLAGGGALQGGNPYLVGERGAELIVPSSAGTIMNNHNTKNALGGGGGTVVNQTINVQSGVAQTVRAEMISLLPRFKQDTMNAVVDAKRRGGSFGQAFG